jgi:hypothetical protein
MNRTVLRLKPETLYLFWGVRDIVHHAEYYRLLVEIEVASEDSRVYNPTGRWLEVEPMRSDLSRSTRIYATT